MKKYLLIICLMVGLTASAQNGEVFSVLKLEPQATAPTNAFWTNGSLYRGTDGVIYHKKDGSWEPLGGSSGDYLPLDGSDPMTGNIDMDQNDIEDIDGLYSNTLNTGRIHLIGQASDLSTGSYGVNNGVLFFNYTDDKLRMVNSNSSIDTFATEDYVDSAVSGGGTDDQTAAEVSVDASGFDGNLDTGDDDVQKVAQKLDDLNINLGGGIVAEGTFNTTSGTGLYTVTHGLGYTPAISRIQIQEINRPDGFGPQASAVQNITATTFDVKGTTTTTFSYSWKVFGADSETPLDFGEVASGLDTELGSTDWRTGGSVADGSITTAKLADGAVTSTKILDATILNADIHASAGIAATKIAYDNTDSTLEAEDAKEAFDELDGKVEALGTASAANLIDDDTFSTASSTNIPSAESVKTYVDASASTGITWEVATTATIGPEAGGKIFEINDSSDQTITVKTQANGEYSGNIAYSFYINPGSTGKFYVKGETGAGVPSKQIDTTGRFYALVRRGENSWRWGGDLADWVDTWTAPAGTKVINGGFVTATDWGQGGGGTPDYQTGYVNFTGSGSLGAGGVNWKVYQSYVFDAASGESYTVRFRAKQNSGTGNFQVGTGAYPFFNEQITTEWADYEVTFNKGNTERTLSFGGLTSGNTFSFTNVSAVKN